MRYLTLLFLCAITVSGFSAKPDLDLIIDVRTLEEWNTGHLASAQHIPLKEFAEQLKSLSIDKNRTVHLYCRSGNRSGKAKALRFPKMSRCFGRLSMPVVSMKPVSCYRTALSADNVPLAKSLWAHCQRRYTRIGFMSAYALASTTPQCTDKDAILKMISNSGTGRVERWLYRSQVQKRGKPFARLMGSSCWLPGTGMVA